MKSFGSNSECELKERIGIGTRVRTWIVLLAIVASVCSASARVIPARQPSVTTDVVYGQKEDGKGALEIGGTGALEPMMQWFERHLGSAAK